VGEQRGQTGDGSALTSLIHRGRRRHLGNLLVQAASFSTAIALGGGILLLLVGTQILNWYWLVILFTVSLAAGIYRTRNQVLSGYQIAQSIDARLDLHDSLSTAFYFGQHSGKTAAVGEFIEQQREVAEGFARTADVRVGIPFVAPRTLYINAALVVAVGTMFGLRYGINHSLDLRPSLVRIGFDGFLGSPREVADAKHKQGKRPFDEDGHRDQGMAVDPWQAQASDLDPAPDSALKTIEEPEVNNPDGGPQPSSKSKATGNEQQPPGEDPLESEDKGQASPPGSEAVGDPNASPDGSNQSGKQQNSPKNANDSANSGENSSLSDKMRDALANLLAKLKIQPKPSDGKQGGSSSQNSQTAQKQSQSQDANAKSTPGGEQSESNSSAQSQGDQQSQNGSKQAAQGRSEARNSDHNTEDGKSGVGKQDGDKSAREAEQLAAMGKISEIIGKRAANVTGEVMVEVASGKQQLRTQYSQRKATHVEAGGEINRDEVPLAYQHYVQLYFEEVRKMPKAKASDGKPKSSGN
jgi:hypothetical protein